MEKIQEPTEGLLAVMIYSGGRKRQLCLRFGRKDPFCFVTAQRISVGRAPSAPIMRLRKYAAGRRIVACVPQWSERRLWLLLGGGADAVNCAAADADSTAQPLLTWLLLDLREACPHPPKGGIYVSCASRGGVMFERTVFLRKMRGFLEQVLETQECADALVERIFVGDHAEVGPRRRKILFILSYLQANLNSQL